MLIKEILPFYKGKYQRRDIQNLAFRLEDVTDSTLFFNLKSDLTLSLEAIDRGAIVVSEKITKRCSQIIVTDIRAQFSLACKHFYHNAVDKLKVYAITGTNGKTTTAYMLRSIFSYCGKNCALVGTNGVIIGERKYAPTLTTPDPNVLHALFFECVKSGITHVVIEASAHALYLKKLEGITFQAVGFTNFSQDHLDFFGTMEKYLQAKETLISSCKTRVINVADDVGKEWLKRYSSISYNEENSDIVAQDITLNASGSDFNVRYKDKIAKTNISIAGRYNISNALCAVGLALTAGISLSDACNGLKTLESVDGRMNVIKSKTRTIVIDFAHTDDGLNNLINAVRGFTTEKIITVFGCGGNRDKSKRALMGKVASFLSDITIETSDNPRYESAEEIIKEIEKGIDRQKEVDYFTIPNRTNAINFALSKANENDTVIIAGKGAENYMEIRGEKLPYSDYNCVNDWIKENEK